jgi:hypothetical protein
LRSKYIELPVYASPGFDKQQKQSTPPFTHFRGKKPHFVNYRLFSGQGIFILAVTFAGMLSSNGRINMRKRNTIRIVIVSVVLAAAFLVLRSAASGGKNNSSKESMEQCCKKKNAESDSKTTWGNLSQQFFSSI